MEELLEDYRKEAVSSAPGARFIDESALALKMLEYEKKHNELEDIKKTISLQVELLGKTVVAGRVRATYSQGRKKYDYESVTREHYRYDDEVVSMFTKAHPDTVDWKAMFVYLSEKYNNMGEIPFTQGDPSVSIKIKKE